MQNKDFLFFNTSIMYLSAFLTVYQNKKYLLFFKKPFMFYEKRVTKVHLKSLFNKYIVVFLNFALHCFSRETQIESNWISKRETWIAQTVLVRQCF